MAIPGTAYTALQSTAEVSYAVPLRGHNLLRSKKEALDFLEAEINAGVFLFVSVISRVEIHAGIRKGEEDVDIDVTIADRAGEYLRKFGKSHALNIGDALIASTAKEMKLRLITRNVKHYPGIGFFRYVFAEEDRYVNITLLNVNVIYSYNISILPLPIP